MCRSGWPVQQLASMTRLTGCSLFFDNLAAVEVAIHKQRRRETRKFFTSLFLAISA